MSVAIYVSTRKIGQEGVLVNRTPSLHKIGMTYFFMWSLPFISWSVTLLVPEDDEFFTNRSERNEFHHSGKTWMLKNDFIF